VSNATVTPEETAGTEVQTVREKPVAQLGKQKALELEGKFLGSWKDSRLALLDLFEGKAHKAFGYANFTEYAAERLGLTMSESTINKNLAAAKVERHLRITAGPDKEVNVPVTVAVELNKLPKERWGEVYNEFEALDNESKSPKKAGRSLGMIVTRTLKSMGKAVSKQVSAMGRKPVDTKPVVAATYDGSEEQKAREAEQANGSAPPAPTTEAVMANTMTKEGVSVQEYGLLLSFARRVVQYYGTDGEAMSGLVKEIEEFISRKDKG
jgi:hypothetical protein